MLKQPDNHSSVSSVHFVLGFRIRAVHQSLIVDVVIDVDKILLFSAEFYFMYVMFILRNDVFVDGLW